MIMAGKKPPTNKKPGIVKRGYDPGLTRNGVPKMQRLPENWRAEREIRERPRLRHLRSEWSRIREELIARGESPESIDREMKTYTGMMHDSYNERMRTEAWLGEVERKYGEKGAEKRYGIKVNWETPMPKKGK
jgi:hypothetical protein